MKFAFLILSIALSATNALAVPIVLDPDDFADGTNLSNINAHVHLATTNGGNVYASTLSSLAAGGNNTKGLGHKVFTCDNDTEWDYQPFDPDQTTQGMEITFKSKVTYFSLLVAELFFDAGPGSEPIFGMVYDDQNNLLANVSPIQASRVTLGMIDPPNATHGYWAYWKVEYSAASIGKIIIGGDSEPTTLDHLAFNYVETPEPTSFMLAIIGIFGSFLTARFKQRRS